MDPTKKAGNHRKTTLWLPFAAKKSAGPGHSEANAQPIPKIAEPRIKGMSITRLVGTENWFAFNGHFRAFEFGHTPKPSTN